MKYYLIIYLLFDLGLSQCLWESVRRPLTYRDILDVYFINNSTGFIVDYGGSVYKTTNAGQNWQRIFGAANVLNRVWFLNEQQGFVCGYVGSIYKTTDGGSSWAQLATPSNQYLYGIAFWDSLKGIAAGGPLTSGEIWNTTDAGTTWSVVYNTDKYFTAVDVAPGGWGYASAYRTGYPNPCEVVKTTDYGQTWGVVYSNPDLQVLGIDCLDSTTIWVACWHPFTGGSRVLRSTNGGTTWEEYFCQTDWRIQGVKFYNRNLGFVCSGDMPNGNFIMRTSDGGITWEMLNPPTRNYLKAIAYPDSQRVYVVGFKSTILFTSDRGASWEFQAGSSSNHLHAIDGYDYSHLLAVGDEGIIVRSTDGGRNWFHWVNYPNNWRMPNLWDVSYITPNFAFACGWASSIGGLVIHTTDGGISWNPISYQPSPNDYWWSMCFADSLHGWVAGDYRIFYTSDGGSSWTQQFYNVNCPQFADMEFVDTLFGFAVARNSYAGCPILKTTDAGNNWQVLTPLDHGFNDISLVDRNTAYISSGDTFLLKTTDGGDNWNVIGCPPASIVSFANRDQGWTSYYTGIYHTYDGGSNFHKDSTTDGVSATAGEIFISDTINAWIVSNNGRIHRYTKLSGINEENNKRIPAGLSLILASPAVGQAKIKLGIETGRKVKIEIYNSAGQKVETIYDGETSGSICISWPKHGCQSSGVYFLKIRIDAQTISQKFILMR